jgi:hypothetical protein
LSHTTSKIRTICKFFTFDLETALNTECVSMCVICLHAKFHEPNSDYIAVKPKAKYAFHGAIFCCRTLKNTWTEFANFSNVLLFLMSGSCIKWPGAVPTTQVRASVMLVLL